MPKRYTKQADSGEGGINLIADRVREMGFIWHPRRIDHGIDGEIELVNAERQPLNRVLLVQSKAQRRFPGETERSFHYVCEPDDLDYWLEANVPVILVCSHPDSREAWWASITSVFRDPARRRTRQVDFDKERDRFDSSAAQALLDQGVSPAESLYIPSRMKPEVLTTNLLRVERFPPTIWATPAIVADNREAGAALRRHEIYAVDWAVLDGTLFSFRRTDGGDFRTIVDGRAEALNTTEWSQAKAPDTVRNFVRVLNQTLAESMHHELRRHPRRHYLYFRPTDDLGARRVTTGKSRTGRVVFQAYRHPKEPGTVQYYRHHALDHHFVRLDGQWFLELNPTYHFTSDGFLDLPWSTELVKGMKRRERNAAVKGLVDMWARYLGADNLFVNEEDRPLRFGALETFTVDQGIDERTWKRPSPAPRTVTDTALPLFEAS
jgi:hypothetical protein